MAPTERKFPRPVRSAARHHHELDAVPEAEHELKQRSEQQTHEQRESEQQSDTQGTVAVALDRENPAVEDREDREEGKSRARPHEAEIEIRPDRRADHRRNERYREEPVGVAQDAVLPQRVLLRRGRVACMNGLEFGLHIHPPFNGCFDRRFD